MKGPLRLLPILLVLALLRPLLLQAREASVSPFENEIEAFETDDRHHAPPQNAVLFIGSSSIRRWSTLTQDFPGVPVIGRGIGGSSISDCTRYAERIVIPYHPRRIVFYAGENDLAGGLKPGEVLANFQKFVVKVRGALPGVPILFISIKPDPQRLKLIDQVKATNSLIRNYANSGGGVGYVDVFTPMLGADGLPRKELFVADGLHMAPQGYELWARLIAPEIR